MVKKWLVALIAAFILVCVPAPSNAAAPPLCKTSVVPGGIHIRCTANGLVVLDTTLPVSLPTVTLPPLPAPTVTVTAVVPGPTKTKTKTVQVKVPVAGPTKTVTLPPGTKTVTLPPQTKTQTVTLPPKPNKTVTIGPSKLPQPEQHATIAQEQKPVEHTVIKKVGIGLLVALALAALAVIAFFAGYKFGFTDGVKNETKSERKWMRDMLDGKRY